MRTVYALFVGIDEYPVKPLNGCVTDVRAAESWLRRQEGLVTHVLPLHNRQATRAAVLAGIEGHLARSGPGETALLWFSGHGSQWVTDDPREATGWAQALVCYDSLREDGQVLLQDDELGPLLDRVAARGTHVVAILDCCHAGGATRDGAPGTAGSRTRSVPWQPWWRTRPAAGSRDGGGPGPEPQRHVLLAACRPQELSREDVFDGEVRGLFSHTLLRTLNLLGPAATYGEVHTLVEEGVRSRHSDRYAVQHPELRGPEDGRFLSGEPLPSSPFLLRHTVAGWEVNCGSAHGLRATGAEFTLLGGTVPRTVVVRTVRPESSLVEPVGWQPEPADRESVFAVTPSALAFAPASVTLTGNPEGVRLLSGAVASVPLLTTTGGDGLPLRVEAFGGLARVTGGEGHPVPDLPLRSPADAARVADCLAHITRWHHIRHLAHPGSPFSGRIRVTVEETPVGRMRHAADGEVVCTYTPDGREPQVLIRIHNDTLQQLWCVLLDLTDSYESSPHLYEGEFIAPGKAGPARRGEPVWLRLPPGRSLVRGAFTRDFLKVIVAENELNLAPFRLAPWSPHAPSGVRGGTAPADGLLRLTTVSGTRDAGGPADGVGHWGTVEVAVRTEVP